MGGYQERKPGGELRQSDSLGQWPVQTAIKDSFVWVMGPQRFVTLTPCKLAL